jgi:hypothetical protein
VGAVNTQLLSMPWLAVRAIDLRSTHPRIEQRDFFDVVPAAEFGAVVCSMARGGCCVAAHMFCVRVLRVYATRTPVRLSRAGAQLCA